MKKQMALLSALAATIGTTCGAPVQAQVNNHLHPAIVVPGACGTGNTVWTDYNGHHALVLTEFYEDGESDGYSGFEVLGNVQAVEHGTVPATLQGRAPLEPGYFSFDVASLGPSANDPYFLLLVNTVNAKEIATTSDINQKGTIYVHVPTAAAAGSQPAEIRVYLFSNEGAGSVRAVVGNFVYNGVSIPGSTLLDTHTQEIGTFCY